MTVETIIASLSQADRRNALELLWASLERDSDAYTPPDWHGTLLAERLANPSSEPAMPVREAMDAVRNRVDARRTSS
ncbi:hypothetical protein CA13_00530 [Planctomycetes bacterium CA13]|uniref:Addiction module component n=1 Tax=Novipirellula herctigrandis TaxID=2527986 RepID=A0A5C5YVW1_9BACT|nr:hypothetical protein CA13_00530 [Planctomycetes bacterium CA13]